MKILVTGGTGQLGSRLAEVLAPFGDIVAPGREVLDLTDLHAAREAVADIVPDLVIHAAGFSRVDAAEADPEAAMTLNAKATGALAGAAAEATAAMIFYSSAYVFDGGRQTPYREDDQPAPVNRFGSSKLAGETALGLTGIPHIIYRCGWLYSARGRNFVTSLLDAGQRPEGGSIAVASDQSGSPTPVGVVAEATIAAVKRGREDIQAYLEAKGGLYHISCRGGTSWHGLAAAVIGIARKKGLAWHAGEPVAASHLDLPFHAARPRSSRLSTGRIEDQFGISPPNWRDALEGTIADYVKARAPG